MKEKILGRLLTITVVIIIVLLTFGMHQLDRATSAQKSISTSEGAVTYWRDKHNHSNALVNNLVTDKENLLRLHANFADSLKKLGIKIKNVDRIITVNTTTTDTIFLHKNKYSDKWTKVSLKDSVLVYSNKDSLALIPYNKKYGLLNLKTSYVTRAISFNPHTTLTGITSIEIKPAVRRLSLGIYSGYGATKSGNQVYTGVQVGLGISYRIF
jgi:hypothetical protein